MTEDSVAGTPSRRLALYTALGANVAVAIAKGVAAAITGSSAVLAESLHSVADSVNEVLLLVGARRAVRPADLRHPFGHARYRYLYAFVVSLAVFWIGGVLSVLEGINHLVTREEIVDPRWALGVLALAALLDGWSLRTTKLAWRSAKGDLSWRRLISDTKAPDLIVVFLEDVGALAGVAIAAVGVTLTTITGDGVWDAVASIAIGILLMAIGLVVNRETQSLLVGESAVADVVAAGVWVDATRSATAISRSIEDAERRVRDITPFRTVVTVEPRVRDAAPSGGREMNG